MQQITDTISLEYLRPTMCGSHWAGKVTDEVRVYQRGVDGYKRALLATPEADYAGISDELVYRVYAVVASSLEIWRLPRRKQADAKADIEAAIRAWMRGLGVDISFTEAANTIT